jgi:hypothetical protein
MGYEIFKRTSIRVDEPALSLVPDGRIAFNAAAVRVLEQAGVKSVQLLWDSKNNRMALKAVPKGDKNAFAVSAVRNSHSASLRAKSFLIHIGWNAPKRTLFPATWDEKNGMFEIVIPQKFIIPAASRDQKLKAKTAT